MHTGPANANGHRRRQLRTRVLAEETHCALCGHPVNKTLGMTPGAHGPRCPGQCTGCVPDPQRAEVDEDIPRSRGGSPYDRNNCHLFHRECNRWKGTRTLTEALAARQQQALQRATTNLITW
jgi:5-methylcytosine-specific restriction endonuclease McrA